MSAETFLLSPTCIFSISLWILWQRVFTSSENCFLCSFLITAVDPRNMRGLNFAFMVFRNRDCSRCVVSAWRSTSHNVPAMPAFTPSALRASLSVTRYLMPTLCSANCLPISIPATILTAVDQLAVSQRSSCDLDRSRLALVFALTHPEHTVCSVCWCQQCHCDLPVFAQQQRWPDLHFALHGMLLWWLLNCSVNPSQYWLVNPQEGHAVCSYA